MVLDGIDHEKWLLCLGRVKRALDILSHPERSYKSVIVGGTNGKGSTCVYLERILCTKGFSVGTNLSPHVTSFNERFRIDSRQVSIEEINSLANRLRPLLEGVGLTYFEWCVVLAAALFQESGVDVGIFEVGLGGRLDASNAMEHDMAIITSISLDHRDYLGHTLRDITGEKAFISRPGRPVITCNDGDIVDVIEGYATGINAKLMVVHEPLGLQLGIEGSMQGLNAALALKAAQLMGLEPNSMELAYALNTAFLPGRVEGIGNAVILDVAHNVSSMVSLVEHLKHIGFNGTGVLGILRDKDYMEMAIHLKEVCKRIHVSGLPTERSWGADAIREVEGLGGIYLYESVREAFHAALNLGAPVVVTGSFYTVGEVRDILICQG